MALDPVAYRFSVEEYHAMADVGIFDEDSRVELLDGEVVEMTPIGSRHASCVDRLTQRFTAALGERVIVRVQNPVVLDPHSEPEPDLCLLAPRHDFYAEAHPRPPDVLLLVEVADSSAGYDRRHKLGLYARSGVEEVWLVDLVAGVVESHRRPSEIGFGVRDVLGPGATVSPAALPDLRFEVGDMLGLR